MSARKGLAVAGLCVLAVGLLAGTASAGRAMLLNVRGGQMPGDTNEDPQVSLEEKAELGGNALKVVFAQGSSFGDTRPKVTNWTGFKAIRFDALNPSQEVLSATLTLKHKGTTSFPTRVDVPLMLKPGKNAFEFALADLANVDGSRPDLSFVKHWYVSCDTAGATAWFGDFTLEGAGAAAAAPAAAPAAGAPSVAPPRVIRVTGKIGDMAVDLTITGLDIGGLIAAGGTAPAQPPAGAPAPAPAAGAKATLLAISKGSMPNDTNEDPQVALDDKPELGGVCLKVTFTKGSSFGMSRAGLKDWRGYATLRFTAFNPANAPLTVSFTIKHGGSKSFGTRVDKEIVLAPGKNEISIPIGGAANNDGSAADLASVRQWYIACEAEATVFFGDFVLEGGK